MKYQFIIILIIFGNHFGLAQQYMEISAQDGYRSFIEFNKSNSNSYRGYKISYDAQYDELDFNTFSVAPPPSLFGIQSTTMKLKGHMVGIGRTPKTILHVQEEGAKFSSPSSSLSSEGSYTEVVGYFENTIDDSHTAITVSGNPGQDAIIYFAHASRPVWDIRSDFTDNQLEFRYQGSQALNNTRLKLTDTGNLSIDGTASNSTGGSWNTNSDRRLKKNINTLRSEEILQKVLSMRGVTYEWNDDKTGYNRPEGVQYGFIAQDLQKIWPNKIFKDQHGFLITAYGDYDPMFVEAIKAQQSIIESQQEQINNQQAQINSLIAEVNSIKLRIKTTSIMETEE